MPGLGPIPAVPCATPVGRLSAHMRRPRPRSATSASTSTSAVREASSSSFDMIGFRLVDHDGREVLGPQQGQTPHPVRAGVQFLGGTGLRLRAVNCKKCPNDAFIWRGGVPSHRCVSRCRRAGPWRGKKAVTPPEGAATRVHHRAFELRTGRRRVEAPPVQSEKVGGSIS
jgi:hypothetical protein